MMSIDEDRRREAIVTEGGPIPAELHAAHQQFLALVDDVRPELHRYCARMMGSVLDGEDVVQDALATAYYELSQLRELPALKVWLFRIAHHRAIDHLRRRDRQASLVPLEEAPELPIGGADAEMSLEHAETVNLAISRFVELPPVQRSCVVLKDVLDYSLEEIASMLGMTVGAVKAALHRGRMRLRHLAHDDPIAAPRVLTPEITRYAQLFSARDWDGIRAMLVEDVKLDLVSRRKRAGLLQVSEYLTNYDRARDWVMKPIWLEGREVIGVWRDMSDPRPTSLIELSVARGRITAIRDFVHAPYLLREAVFEDPPPS
jgi:RNA polymerase sigma factor (sigma-70 family)